MFKSFKTLFAVLIFTFSQSWGGHPISLSENSVDVISGFYIESNADILIPGPLPVTLKRVYGPQDGSHGYLLAKGWRWEVLQPAKQLPKEESRLHIVLSSNAAGELDGIKVLGANNRQTFSWLRFDKKEGEIDLTTHDGQNWKAVIEKGALESVAAPGGEAIDYEYANDQITCRKTSDGHVLINELYQLGDNDFGDEIIAITDPGDPRIGKVRLQKTVTDKDAPAVTIARYRYGKDFTEVTDPAGKRVVYQFAQDRVHTIEIYDHQCLVRRESFEWDSDSSRLISQSVFGPKNDILKSLRIHYDPEGRLIKETVAGRLTGGENGAESYSRYREYSPEGLLIRKSEDNGMFTNYRYDPESFLLIESESGQESDLYFRTEYEYDPCGILIKTVQTDLTSDSGETKTTLFTPSQKPHSAGLPAFVDETLSNASGRTKTRTTLLRYAERGQVSEKEIFDSESKTKKVVRKSYDPAGREIYCSDSGKGDFLTVYYPEDSTVVQTDMETGEITESRYNFQKRVTCRILSKTTGETLVQSNTYDALGRLLLSRDVLDNETEFAYDSLGRLIEKIDPPVLNENDVSVRLRSYYAYDPLGRMTAFTDPNGDTTRFSYTLRGKPYLIEYPDGSTERFIYNPDGTLRSHQSRDGKKMVYDRDGIGRVIETRFVSKEDDLIETKTANYRGWSGMVITNNEGKTREFTFDEEKMGEDGVTDCPNCPRTGEKCGVALKSQTKAAAPDYAEHLDYNFVNDRGQRALQKTIVQPDGTMLVTTFDALGRIEKVQVKNPFGDIIAEKECRYDGAGRLVKQRDVVFRDGAAENSIETRWKYSSGGHLEEKIESANSSNPRVIAYEHDKFGNLTKVVKPDGVCLDYVYHPSGDLKRVSSSDGTVDCEYFYDAGRHVIRAVDHVRETVTIRDYDEEGRMIREVLANGLEIGSVYNDDGKRTHVNFPDGTGILYEYKNDKLASVCRLDSGGGKSYTHHYREYNSKGFLKEAKLIHNLGNLSIRRNSENRIKSLTSPFARQTMSYEQGKLVRLKNESSLGKCQKNYSYNDLGQLTRDGDVPLEYDSVDNMLSKGSEVFEMNDLNQVVRRGGTAYAYDPNGNLISKIQEGRITAYRYDALDRLIAVETEEKTIRYDYDPFHRRLSKIIDGQAPVHFLFDGDNEIGQADDQLEIRQLRILGLGHGAEIGAAVALEIKGSVYVPLHDHRGSALALIDARTKKIVESYDYDAFGKEAITDGKGRRIDPEKSINPWRFSSKRIDSDTGLVHFGKREYDPQLCRWVSQDPLGFFDSVNRYAFARNNPLENLDLYGLFSISTVWESMNAAARYIHTHVSDCLNNSFETFHPFELVYDYLWEAGNFLVGDRYLILAGLYSSTSHTGVYGGGHEPHEKYRITFINGILTAKHDLEVSLALISESHGGCNVHYCYVGTRGWTYDLFRCIFSKVGASSPEAAALAEIWRGLIADMGGTESGGIIFHYAHSLGGTETLRAKYLLTPEEQKMIRVITMGSPTLIPDDGFHSVVNIISCRDIISIFDPITFMYSLLFGDTNVFFVGSHWDGWPIVDHPFYCYWDHWMENFWHEYEDMISELFQ